VRFLVDATWTFASRSGCGMKDMMQSIFAKGAFNGSVVVEDARIRVRQFPIRQS
jgi:hypothetical protein